MRKKKKEKIDPEKIKEINKLLDIKSYLEELSKAKITYSGLKTLTPDNKYSLFVAWNHKYPILGIGTSGPLETYEEKYMELPEIIGCIIEILLGNTEDTQDFEEQIKEACQTFKAVLTAAAHFGGEEVIAI